jgi:hypothetical protein
MSGGTLAPRLDRRWTRERTVSVARYEIRVKGRMSASLQSAFPNMTAAVEPVETVLSGTFEDQAALYGVLLQIEGLGLELVEVRHVMQADLDGPPRRRDAGATSSQE